MSNMAFSHIVVSLSWFFGILSLISACAAFFITLKILRSRNQIKKELKTVRKRAYTTDSYFKNTGSYNTRFIQKYERKNEVYETSSRIEKFAGTSYQSKPSNSSLLLVDEHG